MKLPLTLVHYIHKPHNDYTVHLTPDDARAHLAAKIRPWWYRIGPCDATIARTNRARCQMPGCTGAPTKPDTLTDHDTIDIYFGHLTPAETYTLTTVHLDLGDEFSTAMGYLAITTELAGKAERPEAQAEFTRAITTAATTIHRVLLTPRTATERETRNQP